MNHIHIFFDVISYGIGFLTVILGGLIFWRTRDPIIKYYFLFVSGTFFINLSYINDTLSILMKTPVNTPGYQTLPLYLIRIFFYLGTGLMAYFGPRWLCQAARVRLAKTAKIGLLCAFFLVTFQDLIPYFDNYAPKRSFIYALFWHFNGLFFIFLALGMISVIIAYYQRMPNRFKWYLKTFIVVCLFFIPLEFLSNYFGAYWEKSHLVPRYFFTTSFFYLIWSLVNIQFLVKQFLLQGNPPGSNHNEITDLDLQAYPLSAREKEIIKLMAQGYSNQEIAATLHITVATVKTHFHRIYAKTGVKSRMELLCKIM